MFFKLFGYDRPGYKAKYPMALTAVRDIRRASTIHVTWVDNNAWFETRNPSMCGEVEDTVQSLVNIEDEARGLEVIDHSNGHRRPYIVPLSFVQGLLCPKCAQKFAKLTGLSIHETLERAIQHELYEQERKEKFRDECEKRTGRRGLAYPMLPGLPNRPAFLTNFRHRNFRPGDCY